MLGSIITKLCLGGLSVVLLHFLAYLTGQHSHRPIYTKDYTERVNTDSKIRAWYSLVCSSTEFCGLGFSFRSMAPSGGDGTLLFHLHALAGKGAKARAGTAFYGTGTLTREENSNLDCILSYFQPVFSPTQTHHLSSARLLPL